MHNLIPGKPDVAVKSGNLFAVIINIGYLQQADFLPCN